MIQNHAYLIRRNGIFYFSRRVPSDVRSRFNKGRVIVSLHTRSLPKAQRSAAALSDRLERYWDSIRLEVFHTRELGLSLVQEVEADRSGLSVSIQDALDNYLRLKGAGRSKTFFQGAERAVGYLTEATSAEELSSLSASDAARFRDHLIGKGMTAASVRRVFDTQYRTAFLSSTSSPKTILAMSMACPARSAPMNAPMKGRSDHLMCAYSMSR